MVVKAILHRRNRSKIANGKTEYYIELFTEDEGKFGMEGTWKGNYNWANIFRVHGKYWIGMDVLKQCPVFCFEKMEEVINYIEEEFGVIMETVQDP